MPEQEIPADMDDQQHQLTTGAKAVESVDEVDELEVDLERGLGVSKIAGVISDHILVIKKKKKKKKGTDSDEVDSDELEDDSDSKEVSKVTGLISDHIHAKLPAKLEKGVKTMGKADKILQPLP